MTHQRRAAHVCSLRERPKSTPARPLNVAEVYWTSTDAWRVAARGVKRLFCEISRESVGYEREWERVAYASQACNSHQSNTDPARCMHHISIMPTGIPLLSVSCSASEAACMTALGAWPYCHDGPCFGRSCCFSSPHDLLLRPSPDLALSALRLLAPHAGCAFAVRAALRARSCFGFPPPVQWRYSVLTVTVTVTTWTWCS